MALIFDIFIFVWDGQPNFYLSLKNHVCEILLKNINIKRSLKEIKVCKIGKNRVFRR